MSKMKDSVFGTFLVAFVVCAVCSIFVASAAVILRPIQAKNAELFKNKNILIACGMIDKNDKITAEKCEELLNSVRILKVDLSTQKIVAEGAEALQYDERTAAKTPGESVAITGSKFNVGLASRGRYGLLFVAENPETKEKRVVLPLVGRGLWSVMSAFIALDGSDMNTVKSLLFYDQGETAGLGGEVENPNWAARWVGKKAFDGNQPAIRVIKGAAPMDSEFEVDGISGATLTCNGVNGTVGYWLALYKPVLDILAEEEKMGGNE